MNIFIAGVTSACHLLEKLNCVYLEEKITSASHADGELRSRMTQSK